MKSIVILCALCLPMLILIQAAQGDMGRILAAEARVGESAQKAIILHNGAEEVLILGTDMQADQEVGILRFIPFPSEPSVSLAPDGVFDTVAELLSAHRIGFLSMTKGGAPGSSPVELLQHQQLGAHDMTVIKVNDPVEFRIWANNYFAGRDLPAKKQYDTVEAVVHDYVQRGLVYFALDYVELSTETRFIEPVLYRFESAKLYYPLKTSNTFGGQGEIDLFLFLPGTLCEPTIGPSYATCMGFPNHEDNARASTSSEVNGEEVATIYPQAGEFFGHRPVFLQMFKYYGEYSFDWDILEDIGAAIPQALDNQETDDPRLRLEEFLPPRDPRCSLVPDPGPCKGFFEVYYFDQTKGSCQPTIHGGCDGVVPFETMEECRAVCMPGNQE